MSRSPGYGRRALALGLCGIFWATASAAQTAAAEVTLITGKATALSIGGTLRQLNKGAPVYSGELVVTGANSYANLKFTDGGLVLLRPVTRFRIENYEYSGPAPEAETAAPLPAPSPARGSERAARALFRVLKGGLRTVTGLVGAIKRDDYSVTTPVATIGIRGTDYIAVLCDSACALDPVIRASLPSGGDTEGALIAGVYQGSIDVTHTPTDCRTREGSEDGTPGCPEAKTTTVQSGHYVITLQDGQQQPLAAEPAFMSADPMPSPLTCL